MLHGSHVIISHFIKIVGLLFKVETLKLNVSGMHYLYIILHVCHLFSLNVTLKPNTRERFSLASTLCYTQTNNYPNRSLRFFQGGQLCIIDLTINVRSVTMQVLSVVILDNAILGCAPTSSELHFV